MFPDNLLTVKISGDIAIDDVLVRSGPCFEETTTEASTSSSTTYVVEESPLNCDFETESCKWGTKDGSSGEWEVISGQSADHTTGDNQGSFLSLTSPCSALTCMTTLRSEIPVMISPGEREAQCLQFWYRVRSPLWSGLSVTAESVSTTELWLTAGVSGNDWTPALIELSPQSLPENVEYFLNFRAEYGDHVAISLDDISLSPGSCPAGDSQGCTFESEGQCGWHRETESGGSSWERVKASDHTSHTELGHSMLLSHGSSAQSVTQLLVSPLIPSHQEKKCFNFFYLEVCPHQGAEVRLEVYRRSPGQDISALTPIFQLTECIEAQWMLGVASLPVAEEEYEIVVSGTVTNSSLYLDDVSLGSSHCGTRKDLNRCTFESGTLCGWTNLVPPQSEEGQETEDFLVESGGGRHFATAPFPGQATLLSQPGQQGEVCLSLSTLMSRQDSLNIKAYHYSASSANSELTDVVLWHGSQSSNWERHAVTLHFNETYHLYIEATVVDTAVSLDDIKIQQGKCEDENDKFDCGDGQLVNTKYEY